MTLTECEYYKFSQQYVGVEPEASPELDYLEDVTVPEAYVAAITQGISGGVRKEAERAAVPWFMLDSFVKKCTLRGFATLWLRKWTGGKNTEGGYEPVSDLGVCAVLHAERADSLATLSRRGIRLGQKLSYVQVEVDDDGTDQDYQRGVVHSLVRVEHAGECGYEFELYVRPVAILPGQAFPTVQTPLGEWRDTDPQQTILFWRAAQNKVMWLMLWEQHRQAQSLLRDYVRRCKGAQRVFAQCICYDSQGVDELDLQHVRCTKRTTHVSAMCFHHREESDMLWRFTYSNLRSAVEALLRGEPMFCYNQCIMVGTKERLGILSTCDKTVGLGWQADLVPPQVQASQQQMLDQLVSVSGGRVFCNDCARQLCPNFPLADPDAVYDSRELGPEATEEDTCLISL